MASVDKPTNPKDMIGSDKLPLHLWPQTASAYGCLAMLEGMLKYGRSNFRAVGVRSSIYYDALMRHMNAWFEGEDIDPESGLPHLGKALACIAIIVDAQCAGKLNDDRMYPGGWHQTVQDLTPHVKRLKDQHKDKTPTHYTIQSLPTTDVSPELLEAAFEEMKKVLEQYPASSGLIKHSTKHFEDALQHKEAEGDPNYWGV